jgi:hypothetical protein
MAERERFAHRRGAELVDFEHAGRRRTITVGRFADGRIAELFIDGPKEAPIVELAQESAIVPSLGPMPASLIVDAVTKANSRVIWSSSPRDRQPES